MNKGIQQKSADTLIVENRLRNTQPGELVSYEELSALLGRDFRTHCRSCAATAFKTLRKESIFFDTVTGEGYKRLNQNDACKVRSAHRLGRIRRQSKEAMKDLAHIQFAELDDDNKRLHLTASAQCGAVNLFASGKAAKRIESKVNGSTDQLAIGETLNLFVK